MTPTTSLKVSSSVLKPARSPLDATVNSEQIYTHLNYTYSLTPTHKVSLNPQHCTRLFTTHSQGTWLSCKQHILMRDRCSDNNDPELHREIIPNQYTSFKREVESDEPC